MGWSGTSRRWGTGERRRVGRCCGRGGGGRSPGPAAADGHERLLYVVRSLARGLPVQQMLDRLVLRRRLPAPGLEEAQAALHHQGGAGAAQGARRRALQGLLSRGCARSVSFYNVGASLPPPLTPPRQASSAAKLSELYDDANTQSLLNYRTNEDSDWVST